MRKLSAIKSNVLLIYERVPSYLKNDVKNLMTSKEVLSKTEFGRPFVIRPQEFPKFKTLLEHQDEIRDLKLVPVKDEDTHEQYNNHLKEGADTLLKGVLDIMGSSGMIIMPNEFPYWLSDDVDQNLIWIRDGIEEQMVEDFIAAIMYHFDIPQNEVILFERPMKTRSTLVKGTFPQLRHIHFWTKL